MLRIVIPIPAALARSVALTPVNIVDVVAVEIVVVVNRYITAAVPIAVTPRASPRRAHRNTGSEGKRSVTWRVRVRIRINRRRTVNDGWTVLGNVNSLRIRWLNHDHFFVLNRLRFDFLLCACLKVAGSFRLLAHSLNGIHYVRLLSEKSISEIHHPGCMIAQLFDHIRKGSERLDAWIVGQLCHRFGQRLVL